jgi:putative flippase GtrA
MIKIPPELVKFVIVGAISNIGLYVLYLILTESGVGHKASMSLLYLIGVVQTYFFNKQWTFRDKSSHKVFLTYIIINLVLYGINLASMIFWVDYLKFPHQIIQGFMIIIIAGIFFFLQKKFIFKQKVAP